MVETAMKVDGGGYIVILLFQKVKLLDTMLL